MGNSANKLHRTRKQPLNNNNDVEPLDRTNEEQSNEDVGNDCEIVEQPWKDVFIVSLNSSLTIQQQERLVTAKYSYFTRMKFNDNNVNDVVEVLLNNIDICNITNLDFSDNYLTVKSAHSIARFLSNPKCTLNLLSLDNTYLGDEGGSIIINSLYHNTKLSFLILSRIDFGMEGLRSLYHLFKTTSTPLKALLFWGNPQIGRSEILPQLLLAVEFSQIDKIAFQSCNIKKSIFPYFYYLVRSSSSLVDIGLFGNELSREEEDMIAAQAQYNLAYQYLQYRILELTTKNNGSSPKKNYSMMTERIIIRILVDDDENEVVLLGESITEEKLMIIKTLCSENIFPSSFLIRGVDQIEITKWKLKLIHLIISTKVNASHLHVVHNYF